jgi:class 3 adenylate cyclase
MRTLSMPNMQAVKAPVIRPVAEAAPTAAAATGMKREPLVIAFVDLDRFQIASRRVRDEALVEILEDYYERIVSGLKPAGGRVVKFMGDGALVVFPLERATHAARALLMLKSEIDARHVKRKFASPFVARMHVGEVMSGQLGPKGDKRYDVVGQAVNRAATLHLGDGVVLSSEAWGKLDVRTQKLFKQKGDFYVPT